MATTKKTETKKVSTTKTVKKENKPAIEAIVEEAIGTVPYAEEPKVDVAVVEKAIEEVNTEIPEDIEKIDESTVNEKDELAEVVEKLEEVASLKNDFEEKVKENPEEAEKAIEEQIKKAEDIKKSVEKIIKRVDSAGFTNTWNGISYGF